MTDAAPTPPVNPSPSTAALREALDTCVTALDWIARRWDDSKTMAACADDAYEMKSEAAMALEKSGASTLLAGDNRG